MNWAKFLSDNSQSLFTLVGVFFGSVITFAIGYLNLRSQAKEAEKGRQEQRMAAKIQAKEKWIEHDILAMMDLVDRILRLDVDTRMLSDRVEAKRRAAESNPDIEFNAELVNENLEKFRNEFYQLSGRLNMLIYSLDDPGVKTKYEDFLNAFNVAQANEEDISCWQVMTEKAGELHEALRDKLISIRDS